ncbi:hypothetical protein Tco_0312656 [Tanacetum coccineum]
MDVHVHHEVPSKQTPTLLTVHVSVITKSSPIFTTVIPQSLPSFTPPPHQSTPTPPPTIEATNPLSTLLNFASILPKKVSNFAPLVIKSIVTESLDHAVLAKESSQPKSTYKAVATFIEFELKKILIDKIDESQSYEHIECYDGLIKPRVEKRKTSKDAEPTKGSKAKESQFGSSKGAKSQSTSSGKSVHVEEPEFKVADSDMPHDQEEKPGNVDEEPKGKVASKRDWFTKPKRPQEPTDPDWNVGKTLQQGPTQIWVMTLASSANKLSKTFDELMGTPIYFSAYIMNILKITNLTQETLLGPAFKLLKGTHSNYAELECDFKECYKALSEKLDWDNPEGSDYPFDLTKSLPLVMNGNCQIVPVDYFFNNDLKYLQGGISTMTYTTSITKTKSAQYDLPGIEDMVPNICSHVKVAYDKHALWGISHRRDQRKTFYGYARGLESSHDVYSTKCILVVTRVEVMRTHRYGYPREIEVQRADNDLYTFKKGDFPRLRMNDIEDMLLLVVQNRLTNQSGNDVSDFAIAQRMFTRSMVIQKRVKDLQLGVKSYQKKINVTKPETTKAGIRKRDPYTPYQDPQGFIYVDNKGRNRLMRSYELYKFSDRTLTGLRTSVDDITKNIRMEYLPQRRWSSLEKKRANIMIKAIDKQLKERRMMRSLEKFVGGRHYGTDLRLLQ